MTSVMLIRHSATLWTEQGRLQGRSDLPLSPAGRRDVENWRVPSAMRDWDGVTSPMARARETAAILFGRAVPVVRDLIEMGWGEWEGLTDGDLRARYGLAYDRQEMTGRDFAPPGGESPAAVQARLQPWLTRVGAGKRPTIAIAHKGIIRAVLGLATGWDFTGKPPVRMDWRSGQLFEVDAAGRPALARVNVPLVA